MKRNGFTLIEFLICLSLLGIVLIIGISTSHKMLSTSLVTIRAVSDNEVFTAAKNYAIENQKIFNGKFYTCITVKDLIDYGYLADTNDITLKEKNVMIKKNKITKVIYNIDYTNNCD